MVYSTTSRRAAVASSGINNPSMPPRTHRPAPEPNVCSAAQAQWSPLLTPRRPTGNAKGGEKAKGKPKLKGKRQRKRHPNSKQKAGPSCELCHESLPEADAAGAIFIKVPLTVSCFSCAGDFHSREGMLLACQTRAMFVRWPYPLDHSVSEKRLSFPEGGRARMAPLGSDSKALARGAPPRRSLQTRDEMGSDLKSIYILFVRWSYPLDHSAD